MIQSLIDHIKETAAFVDNPEDIDLEDAIGSDVAQVQSTEKQTNPFESNNIFNPETAEMPSLPLRYSFIMASSNDDSMNNKTKLTAFQQMVDNGSTQQQYHETTIPLMLDSDENNTVINGTLDNLDTIIDANFDDEEAIHPAIASLRAQQPVNEFDSTDQIITTSFPHVFLLGQAYK